MQTEESEAEGSHKIAGLLFYRLLFKLNKCTGCSSKWVASSQISLSKNELIIRFNRNLLNDVNVHHICASS
jgi:hypothetical protein